MVGALGPKDIGHVDAAGAVRRLPLPASASSVAADVAGAPDGSAVYAFGDCTLVRVTSAGAVSVERPPIPAYAVAYDAQGDAVARRADAGRAARRGRVGSDV